MSNVTQILQQIDGGDPSAADHLLPLVYDELHRLATVRMAQESPDHTLQPTALVHEAYLRLIGADAGLSWDNRGHFFAAAAEAMRRILVESARRRATLKRGGDRIQLPLLEDDLISNVSADEILDVSNALEKLAVEDPQAAQLVKLRYFAGLPMEQAADLLGLSRTIAYEQWAYARSWLRCELEESTS